MDKIQEIKQKYKSLIYKKEFREALAKKLRLSVSTITDNFFNKYEISENYHSVILKMLENQIAYEIKVNSIKVKHYEQL